MKKLFITLSVIFLFSSVYSGEWVSLTPEKRQNKNHFKLISSDVSTSVVRFTLEGFNKNQVKTARGTAWEISAPGSAPIMNEGAPELPLFAVSLLIPDKANMEVEIISAKYKTYDNVLIAPSKGNLSRTIDPATVPFRFGDEYSENKDYPGILSKLREPYIIRDYRGQALLIQPFQYNPVTKKLKVYYSITVRVKENGISNINAIERNGMPERIDSRFRQIYSRHFLNYSAQQAGSRYTPVDEHGNLLIISYGDFMAAMQPYIDWKIKTGTPTEIVDVATIGGAPQIKQYVANYYNTNGLTFLLLVGDAPQVPASVIGGNDSDNDYGYVVGNDHYPDLFVGRFSAETEAQVNTMVERTLNYEQTPPSDTAWYTKCIGIGSDQGPGDDGEYDYEHIRNIQNNKLIPFTYNYAYEFFDGSQGGNDAPGNPTPSMVGAAIDSGATVINYCGHGSTTSWGTSGFNNGNVNNLVNDNHLPFIFSVACVNGNFVNNTCFAEAWLRATHNGEPTGAIATIMSTINQSWNPPMCGQDEMNDILVETYANNIKRTFGGITMNGCMEMNDEYGSDGDEMTDTWTIFGDPALIIRTAAPADMTVNGPDELTLGETTMTVYTNATEGTACLSLDGVILASAPVDSNGVAVLNFDPLSTLDTADFVITSFNFYPHIAQLPIVNNMIPNLELATTVINDANGNGQMDYNEFSDITLGIANSGLDTAHNILTTISIASRFVVVTDSTEYYGEILAGDTITIPDGFRVYVTDSVRDMTLAIFQVKSTDTVSGDSWTNSFGQILHAPKLQYTGFGIDDSNGNNNGRLDPGETADILVYTENGGSSDAYNVMTQLTSGSPYITIANSQQNIGNLTAGETKTVAYQVTAAGDAPDGTTAFFDVAVIADYNRSTSGSFYTSIGKKPLAIVKLTENEASADSMLQCLQTLQVGAEVLNSIPDNREEYKSLFVLLGTFPDNHVLTDSEGQQLADYLNNGGRVFMEGADTWAADTSTVVHPMFHINGLSDGLGDLYNIKGLNGSLMQGLQFKFYGNNNYIDRIAPDEYSELIFQNSDSLYGIGVSYENNVYKTVGFSFEFAGLEDSPGNEKDEVMARILNYFGVAFTWTGIDEKEEAPLENTVYPNPFSNSLTVSATIEKNSRVNIAVFDMSGKKVATLCNDLVPAGQHQWTWNATDGKMQPGIYFIKMVAGNKTAVKKVVLMK